MIALTPPGNREFTPFRYLGRDIDKLGRLAVTQTDGSLDVDSSTVKFDPGRRVSYVFSDESVARDQHTIATDGWVLDNFLKNPVALWCHDSEAPPIGRVTSIFKRGTKLIGSIEYADAETYPFADTIYRLTKSGYLNAVSVSWGPLEWEYANDPKRPYGIDFKRQELYEVSAVPVPALPTALATARASGIDTFPLYEWAEKLLDSRSSAIPRSDLESLCREAKSMTLYSVDPHAALPRAAAADWKCGASRNLPIDEDTPWDGPAAAKSVFDACGFDGPSIGSGQAKPKVKKAAKAFLAYDASAPTLKGSYKLPFARIADGRLTALASGIRAAASRLPQTDIPDGVKETARAVIDAYEARMKDGKDESEVAARAADLAAAGFELVRFTDDEIRQAVKARTRAADALSSADCAALEAIHDRITRCRGMIRDFIDTAAAVHRDALEKIHGKTEQTRCMLRDFIDGSAPENQDATGDDGGAASRKRMLAVLEISAP